MLRQSLVATTVLTILLAPELSAQWWQLEKNEVGPCVGPGQESSGPGAPFGYFNGRVDGMDFNAATGVISFQGWALDNNGVAAVDLLVDGAVVGRARYGLQRPLVTRNYPTMPDARAPGFSYQLDTTQFLNGLHLVAARVLSSAGERRILNTLAITFSNTVHNLRPFGKIDLPKSQATLDGNCDIFDEDRRYAVVRGWALDAGIELNDHGVGYVELLLDGARFANSRTSCRHDPVTGAFSNCYGLRRDDIERRYPTLKDSPNAGFRFVLDVGELLNSGYTPGMHTVTIKVGDIDSQVSNIDSISVNFQCEDFFVNQASFGNIHVTRPPGENLGITLIEGWALDREGVARVRVFVDGVLKGLAAYGFPREEVTSDYPGYINSGDPGYMFELDTRQLADGEHKVTVDVIDAEDARTLIGAQTLWVDNS